MSINQLIKDELQGVLEAFNNKINNLIECNHCYKCDECNYKNECMNKVKKAIEVMNEVIEMK